MRTDADALERRVRELELFVEALTKLLPITVVAAESAHRVAAHEYRR